MGLIPTEFVLFFFFSYTREKGHGSKGSLTASRTRLLKRAFAHVAIGNSGGVGRALVRPRNARRGFDGGEGVVGHQ